MDKARADAQIKSPGLEGHAHPYSTCDNLDQWPLNGVYTKPIGSIHFQNKTDVRWNRDQCQSGSISRGKIP